jgi:hypothetical protein
MYRPGMFSANRNGAPLPPAPESAARPSNADWGAFGRRGGASDGGGNNSEHHAAFGRRQPREPREPPRGPPRPVRDYTPANSLSAILDHALKGLEPKEEEWQTRLRKLQKKPAVVPLVVPRPEKPKPVDFSSEEAFPTLGGAAASAPKSAWAPKAQSFATLMKKHVDDEAEAARVEAERKAAEERARIEREREARRYGFMPARMLSGGGGGAHTSYDDDDEDDYNPERDLDYQYNQVRRDDDNGAYEMQAEAVEEEESVEDDEAADAW